MVVRFSLIEGSLGCRYFLTACAVRFHLVGIRCLAVGRLLVYPPLGKLHMVVVIPAAGIVVIAFQRCTAAFIRAENGLIGLCRTGAAGCRRAGHLLCAGGMDMEVGQPEPVILAQGNGHSTGTLRSRCCPQAEGIFRILTGGRCGRPKIMGCALVGGLQITGGSDFPKQRTGSTGREGDVFITIITAVVKTVGFRSFRGGNSCAGQIVFLRVQLLLKTVYTVVIQPVFSRGNIFFKTHTGFKLVVDIIAILQPCPPLVIQISAFHVQRSRCSAAACRIQLEGIIGIIRRSFCCHRQIAKQQNHAQQQT